MNTQELAEVLMKGIGEMPDIYMLELVESIRLEATIDRKRKAEQLEGQWIKTSERLPENKQAVLIRVFDKDYLKDKRIFVARYYADLQEEPDPAPFIVDGPTYLCEECKNCCSSSDCFAAKYWMPLPEAPKD